MTIASSLDAAVRAVAPIIGISMGSRDDKSTWRIDFAPAATQAQRTAAQGVINAFDAAAIDLAEVTEATARDALGADVRADAVFTALQAATPADIAALVTNRFPAFTAPQRAVIKLLLQVAALVLRKGVV